MHRNDYMTGSNFKMIQSCIHRSGLKAFCVLLLHQNILRVLSQAILIHVFGSTLCDHFVREEGDGLLCLSLVYNMRTVGLLFLLV